MISDVVTNQKIKWALADLFGVKEFDDIFEKTARENSILASFVSQILLRSSSIKRLKKAITESNLVFLHVPRNAGTSISMAIYRYATSHRSLEFFKHYFSKTIESKCLFSTLREPEARFLSATSFFLNGGTSLVPVSVRFRSAMAGAQTIDNVLDFIEHCDSNFEMDNVFRSQTWFLGELAKIREEKNLKLFRMDRDEKILCDFMKYYGVANLPKLNQGRNVSSSLSHSQKARVQRLYSGDYDLYESKLF